MTEFDRDDITDTMSSFEAAVSARRQQLPDVSARNVLAAVDGSNQDGAVLALAAEVTVRSGATRLHLTYAYEGPADAARDDYLAARVHELSARTASLAVTHSRTGAPAGTAANRAFQQILDLAAKEGCDLITTAAPYLDEFEQLGTASTGTTLDMLLRHRRTPLLVVRAAYPDVIRCLDRAVVPLNLLGVRGEQALGWAMRLVRPAAGTLHLLALADTEAVAAVGPLIGRTLAPGEMDERMLAGLVKPETAGLVAAAQRGAAHAGLACRVSIRLGEPVQEVVAFAHSLERCLLVTGCPDQCSATGYLRVQALIRESPYPVLVA